MQGAQKGRSSCRENTPVLPSSLAADVCKFYSRGMKRRVRIAGYALLAIGVLIQFVPVARTNPPVKAEPPWDRPETRSVAVRACFDCHSNETKWPWYSRVAPISWMVADHVLEGRRALNFSEWPGGELEEAAEEVRKERMPLASYLLGHPEARLSASEREALARGLEATDRLDRAP